MKALSEQLGLVTKHYFSDGICVRELFIPKGTVVLGAEHKTNHMVMLMQGILQVKIGDESKLVKAPATFEALKGSRKLVFAYTDCIVSNIMPTNLTNIEEIEKEFTDMHDLQIEGGPQCHTFLQELQ